MANQGAIVGDQNCVRHAFPFLGPIATYLMR
jgi:hypothetical protein